MLEQCYGLSRRVLRELVHQRSEAFAAYEDILWFTLDEVYHINALSDDNIKTKITSRRKSRAKNQMLWNSMEVQSVQTVAGIIKGISGNGGKARGKVCIIHDVKEFGKLKQGDILVCKYTDPMWTPLFTVAKAVVSDTGGPLSHSAIVAREFDIPAILGCGNATQSLQDGQDIIVDGDGGTVKLVGVSGGKADERI